MLVSICLPYFTNGACRKQADIQTSFACHLHLIFVLIIYIQMKTLSVLHSACGLQQCACIAYIIFLSSTSMLLPYLNLFKSISVETGKTLSREQSPMSIVSHELHTKCHFCSVCKSSTTTFPTYLGGE